MEMTETDEVLAANLEFYRAFAARDAAAMDALWARRLPVACTHPGWEPLRDRRGIVESWRRILDNPGAPGVMCHDEQVFLYGDVAIVVCEEELRGGTLAATNVFAKEDGAWRIVHHHAGPMAPRRLKTSPSRRPSRLN
jgi:ketosteroid isomerase-like protein